jgi:hypothetical protein
MPIHVDEMTSEVTVIAGDLPLTDAQIDKLTSLVINRIAERQRDAGRAREATELKRQSTSPFEAGA